MFFFVFEEKPNVHKMKDMEIAVNYRIMSLNSRLFISSSLTSTLRLLSKDLSLCSQKVSAASWGRQSLGSDFFKGPKKKNV